MHHQTHIHLHLHVHHVYPLAQTSGQPETGYPAVGSTNYDGIRLKLQMLSQDHWSCIQVSRYKSLLVFCVQLNTCIVRRDNPEPAYFFHCPNIILGPIIGALDTCVVMGSRGIMWVYNNLRC